MINFYASYDKFYIGLDCVIFGFYNDELHLLLIKRNFEPAKGHWSLMGGFLKKEESAEDGARRVLSDLTGLQDVFMEQVGVFSEINRDPGERVVSVGYYAMLNINDSDKELVEKNNAHWIKITDLPLLIFDHYEIIKLARRQMRRKAATAPIGLNLLPELFTLTQMQNLYEAIFDEKIDKRNFRKKVSKMDFIEKTDFVDKKTSRRGAALYKFNDKAYLEDPNFNL